MTSPSSSMMMDFDSDAGSSNCLRWSNSVRGALVSQRLAASSLRKRQVGSTSALVAGLSDSRSVRTGHVMRSNGVAMGQS